MYTYGLCCLRPITARCARVRDLSRTRHYTGTGTIIMYKTTTVVAVPRAGTGVVPGGRPGLSWVVRAGRQPPTVLFRYAYRPGV